MSNITNISTLFLLPMFIHTNLFRRVESEALNDMYVSAFAFCVLLTVPESLIQSYSSEVSHCLH